jgi:superfamily II DNA or RNA helicase
VKRIPLIIDNRARIDAALIDQETITEIQREFTHRNPARDKLERQAEGAKYNTSKPWLKHALAAKLKNEPQTECTWRLFSGMLSVPRGGRERMQHILEDAGYFVDIDDRRISGDLPAPHVRHTVELRPFQRGIVDAVMRDEEGIARSPTGSGKTEALIGALVEANLPSLIIVNEQGLLDQWVRRLRGGLGLNAGQVGIIGGGKKELRPITVGMAQTLRNCVDEIAPRFGFVGCDEVHLFAAKTFLEIVDRLPARYRVGVSADEKRADGKEYLLYDTLGPLLADVKQDMLVEQGFVLEVEVRLVPTDFDRPWWQELDPRSRGLEQNRLLSEMGEDRDRNALAVSIAAGIALEEGQRQQVLVMAHHVDHCRRLLADLAMTNPRVGLLVGDDKAAYTRSLAGLMQGSVQIGVGTYAKMSTGIDIKTLARGVAVTPVHLNRFKLKQILGRYCRSAEGKTDAVLYVLWDRHIFGLAPVENFKRWARRVVVREGSEWVPARDYLKIAKASA